MEIRNWEVALKEEGEESLNFNYSKFDPDAILTKKTEQVYVSKDNNKNPPVEVFLSNFTLWPERAKKKNMEMKYILLHKSWFILFSQRKKSPRG